MSYTPPHTFSAGTSIQAAILQENLQEIQEYANGGVIAGDLSTSPWVEQQHIVRPSYESATRTFTAVSGVSSAAGRGKFLGRYTYVQRATSTRNEDVSVWQFIPGTFSRIELPRAPKAMLVQFSFSGTTPTDSTVATGTSYGFPGSDVRMVLFPGDITDPSDLQSPDLFTEHLLQVEDGQSIGVGVGRRDHQSGFALIEGVGNTLWSIGLVGRSTMPNTRIWRWNVAIESWMV
jgi:hypothetical protein